MLDEQPLRTMTSGQAGQSIATQDHWLPRARRTTGRYARQSPNMHNWWPPHRTTGHYAKRPRRSSGRPCQHRLRDGDDDEDNMSTPVPTRQYDGLSSLAQTQLGGGDGDSPALQLAQPRRDDMLMPVPTTRAICPTPAPTRQLDGQPAIVVIGAAMVTTTRPRRSRINDDDEGSPMPVPTPQHSPRSAHVVTGPVTTQRR